MRQHIVKDASKIKPGRVLFYQGLSKYFPAPHVQETAGRILGTHPSHSFHVTDLYAAERQYNLWSSSLANVEPHYAIKSNASPELCAFFHRCGSSFDVASAAEMLLCEDLGVKAQNIVFSNPCKMEADIALAVDMGIELTVFDTESELEKLASIWPTAKCLIRIKTRDENAQVKFSHRFGADEAEWEYLLRKAKSFGLEVVGVHFHIGSGVANVGQRETFSRAVNDVAEVFSLAQEIGFQNMHVIDCGGGMGAEATLHNLSSVVNENYDNFPGCRWIAEPGRFMSASTQTAASRVIAVRREPAQATVNDGLYGTWSVIPFDHSTLPDTLPYGYDSKDGLVPHQVFGPTCDGYDIISDTFLLPEDIKVSDWIVFAGMGSYTQASASPFNGVKVSKPYVMGSQDMLRDVERILRGRKEPMCDAVIYEEGNPLYDQEQMEAERLSYE